MANWRFVCFLTIIIWTKRERQYRLCIQISSNLSNLNICNCLTIGHSPLSILLVLPHLHCVCPPANALWFKSPLVHGQRDSEAQWSTFMIAKEESSGRPVDKESNGCPFWVVIGLDWDSDCLVKTDNQFIICNTRLFTRSAPLGRRTRPMDMKHFQNKINHTDWPSPPSADRQNDQPTSHPWQMMGTLQLMNQYNTIRDTPRYSDTTDGSQLGECLGFENRIGF